MPKPIGEVEKDDAFRGQPLSDRILFVLKSDPGSAFDTAEILSRVEGVEHNTALILLAMNSQISERFAVAIEQLVSSGRARAFRHAVGGPYYAVGSQT